MASLANCPATGATPSPIFGSNPFEEKAISSTSQHDEKLQREQCAGSSVRTPTINRFRPPIPRSHLACTPVPRMGLLLRSQSSPSLVRQAQHQRLEDNTPRRADSPGGEATNLTVAVRVRPLTAAESDDPAIASIVAMHGNDVTVTSGTGVSYTFKYDHCFSPPLHSTGQEELYRILVQPLMDHLFDGYNACLLAYGQTGSGKTYSLMGDSGDPQKEGIVPRFCRDLFGRSGIGPGTEVSLCYYEVYQEKIRDLLNETRTSLRVREHPQLGPQVVGLTSVTVTNLADIENWVLVGNKHRSMAATAMNNKSSRSHVIVTVTLTKTQTELVAGESHVFSRRSQITLVDLAGSERMDNSPSSASQHRHKEGVSINCSLLTLGKVISALAEKKRFVPYRESVLTWLLRECLGGNSRTTMLATISPASTHMEVTLATLKYACQARTIIITPRVNESNHDRIIRGLSEEVAQLRALREECDSPIGRHDLSKLERKEQADLVVDVAVLRHRESTLLDKLREVGANLQGTQGRLERTERALQEAMVGLERLVEERRSQMELLDQWSKGPLPSQMEMLQAMLKARTGQTQRTIATSRQRDDMRRNVEEKMQWEHSTGKLRDQHLDYHCLHNISQQSATSIREWRSLQDLSTPWEHNLLEGNRGSSASEDLLEGGGDSYVCYEEDEDLLNTTFLYSSLETSSEDISQVQECSSQRQQEAEEAARRLAESGPYLTKETLRSLQSTLRALESRLSPDSNHHTPPTITPNTITIRSILRRTPGKTVRFLSPEPGEAKSSSPESYCEATLAHSASPLSNTTPPQLYASQIEDNMPDLVCSQNKGTIPSNTTTEIKVLMPNFVNFQTGTVTSRIDLIFSNNIDDGKPQHVTVPNIDQVKNAGPREDKVPKTRFFNDENIAPNSSSLTSGCTRGRYFQKVESS